jgi:hypothetical protein
MSAMEDDPQSKAQAEYERINAEHRKWIESLPAAMAPFYPFRAPNEATPLYRGQLRVGVPAGEFSVDGSIEITWQPTPQLRYESFADIPTQLGVALLMEPLNSDFYPADLSILQAPPEPAEMNDREATIEGQLTRLEVGNGQAFSFVTFQLPNFLPYLGDWVRHGQEPDRGRLVLSGAGWRVTIDRRKDLDQIIATVRRSGGYALTHVGRLEREDGRQFSREQAREMLEGLYWFCCFVNGSHSGPLLPVGFNESGDAVWAEWGVTTTSPWHSADGWADAHRPQALANLFPGFLDRWLDPYWRRVVNIGVAYYLDANIPRTLQRAVGLAQIVLELLVYAVLVDEQSKTWDEIKPIGRAIAELLRHYRIPTDIPEKFRELATEASREGWLSGPWAVTALRNEVIHVKRDARDRSNRVWVEAWKLIVWYVELTLLATFGFNGEYGSRLSWPRWVGQVEHVPWAQLPGSGSSEPVA